MATRRKERASIIQSVALDDAVPVSVLMPDGAVISGVGESSIRDEVGKVVQFERFGFVRIDLVSESEIVACFGHK